MARRVAAAFFAWGRRNACTPSAIASTPVRAVAPEEKARSTRKSDSDACASSGSVAVAATGHPPRHLIAPHSSVRPIIATNP